MSRDDPFGLSEDRERTRIRLTGASPRPMTPLMPTATVKMARAHPNPLINTFAPLLEFAPELESALAPENPEVMRTRLLDELVRARDAAIAGGNFHLSVIQRHLRAGRKNQSRPDRGSGPKRLAPDVPRVQNQMISRIAPTKGTSAIQYHQPDRSVSCSLRTMTEIPGRRLARTVNHKSVCPIPKGISSPHTIPIKH